MTNSTLSDVINIEYGKSDVLNKKMRRRSQISFSSSSHSNGLVTKNRGKTSSEVRMIEIKVEQSQNLNTRMFHMAIAIKMGMPRNIVISVREMWDNKRKKV